MKIITIVGARPQFVKAASLSRAIAEHNSETKNNAVEEIIVHTGQHFDDRMSEVFFKEMDIPQPKYNLGIGGGLHGMMTGKMLEAIEDVLIQEKPEWVVLYGDTNSTLAGAVAAVKLHIPIAHVEAGMRSFNKKMPEEINRIIADHCSDIFLIPTERVRRNLEREGFHKERVYNVGDVMYDAFLHYREVARTRSLILETLNLAPKSFVLATVHRAENTDDYNNLYNIISGLLNIAEDLPVVFPVHPRTLKVLQEAGLLEETKDKLRLIEPLGYFDMMLLEENASLIATDSGGIQKEAFFHNVPCLTLRTETEWEDLVELGVNKVVGANRQNIVDGSREFSSQSCCWDVNPYGDGRSGRKIVDILVQQRRLALV